MIVRFGFVSGMGWLIDFSLFALLSWFGAPVWEANMFGASVAVMFVFFTSVRQVFEYEGGYLARKLGAYIIYQTIAILSASFLIDALSQSIGWAIGWAPVLSKIFVAPLTFYANFQFMSLITTGKLRLI